MKDLFTLNDDGEGGSTETSDIFSQLSEDVNVVGTKKEKLKKRKKNKGIAQHADVAIVDNENNSEIRALRREEKEKADCSDGEVDEETNILKSLFDANGIHVSFQLFLRDNYPMILINTIVFRVTFSTLCMPCFC
jgi:DNA excision repair protein ERCC-6